MIVVQRIMVLIMTTTVHYESTCKSDMRAVLFSGVRVRLCHAHIHVAGPVSLRVFCIAGDSVGHQASSLKLAQDGQSELGSCTSKAAGNC